MLRPKSFLRHFNVPPTHELRASLKYLHAPLSLCQLNGFQKCSIFVTHIESESLINSYVCLSEMHE